MNHDIFISYARQDRPRAEILAAALDAEGWSVWWDRIIPAGQAFDAVIGEAIDTAKCIIVLWSETSVKSEWVREEAEEGKRRQILVPVMIDTDLKIPLGFRRVQAAELTDWDGTAGVAAFQDLVRDIAVILGQPPKPQQEPREAAALARREPIEAESRRYTKPPRDRAVPQRGRHAAIRRVSPKPAAGSKRSFLRPKVGMRISWVSGVGGIVAALLLLVGNTGERANVQAPRAAVRESVTQPTVQGTPEASTTPTTPARPDPRPPTRPPETGTPQDTTTKTPPATEIATLSGTYTIQQASSGRYVDAHHDATNDFGLVTRPPQNDNTQRWLITPLGNNTYTIRQVSNGRYVDAHHDPTNDFGLVTRPPQNDDTQRWIITPLGNNKYAIRQVSSGRYVDAHHDSTNDFGLVTRPPQNNDTQRWIIRHR